MIFGIKHFNIRLDFRFFFLLLAGQMNSLFSWDFWFLRIAFNPKSTPDWSGPPSKEQFLDLNHSSNRFGGYNIGKNIQEFFNELLFDTFLDLFYFSIILKLNR